MAGVNSQRAGSSSVEHGADCDSRGSGCGIGLGMLREEVGGRYRLDDPPQVDHGHAVVEEPAAVVRGAPA
jgi:hypothetical protein